MSRSHRKHFASLVKGLVLILPFLLVNCANAVELGKDSWEKEAHTTAPSDVDERLKGTIKVEQSANKRCVFDDLELPASRDGCSGLEGVIRSKLEIDPKSVLTSVYTSSGVSSEPLGKRRTAERVQTTGCDYYEVRPDGELRFIATYNIDHLKNDSVSLIAASEMPAAEQLKHYGCCNSMMVIMARERLHNKKLDKSVILRYYHQLRREVSGPNADLRSSKRSTNC
jgi:hypothetical protein